MDTPSLLLCTFLLAMILSSVKTLSPLEQSMNADIMSDIMDLRRKIMKHQMFLSSMRGRKGGNTILPAAEIGLGEFFPSLGMVPSQISPAHTSANTGSQTGGAMPKIAPTFLDLGIASPVSASKKNNTKNSPTQFSFITDIVRNGKVTAPNKAVINTPMKPTSSQTPTIDISRHNPMGSGPVQNPMAGQAMAAMMNGGSLMNPAGGAMFNQGQLLKPINFPQNGASQKSESPSKTGHAGMTFPPQNLGQYLVQQDICSETPSKLRKMCMTNKDCSHRMKCFSGSCCANSHGHAEILDNMLEHMEKQRNVLVNRG